nr:hypothetical protein [Tanacetum cinerariifolium]
MVILERFWDMLSLEKHALFVDDQHRALKDKGIIDSRCFRHMTGNNAHLADYQEFKGGFVAFGGSNGRITGFLVGYSLNSKAFRVYNLETKRVEENLHVNFLENKPNVEGKGHAWMFNLDFLINSMNYEPVLVENQANKSAGSKEANNSAGTQANDDQETRLKRTLVSRHVRSQKEATHDIQNASTSSTNLINTTSTPLSTVGPSRTFNDGELSYPDPSKYALLDDPSMPRLEYIYASPSEGIFTDTSYDDECVISQALEDKSWVDAMQEELLQFQIQKVWILVDFPFGKKAIRTKWVYRNKKDERGVVVGNKARLVSQGHRQEEGIDYDEVFDLVARIKAIRIFLAFASYMGFIVYQMDVKSAFLYVYQMDVKSAFLYGIINEEMYVSQPSSFVDPKFPNKVYKVVKALYGLHQAPRVWYATLSTFLEKSRYRRGAIDKTLFIKKDKKDTMLVQVYVDDIIFGSTKKSWCDEFEELMKNGMKTGSTPIETQKPLLKDEEVVDVDVTPKTSHLHSVKRIFRYLKGQPKLGLWYPKVSSFDLEAYSNSDYAGANLDRKSTIKGCQFLGKRLISWQCKKQTIVATSTIEA